MLTTDAWKLPPKQFKEMWTHVKPVHKQKIENAVGRLGQA